MSCGNGRRPLKSFGGIASSADIDIVVTPFGLGRGRKAAAQTRGEYMRFATAPWQRVRSSSLATPRAMAFHFHRLCSCRLDIARQERPERRQRLNHEIKKRAYARRPPQILVHQEIEWGCNVWKRPEDPHQIRV